MPNELNMYSIESLETDFEQLMHAWEQDNKAEHPDEDGSDFSNIKSSSAEFPLLSQHRYDLLEIIKSNSTISIYNLTELSGRSFFAVENDVEKLVLAGIIKWFDGDMLCFSD